MARPTKCTPDVVDGICLLVQAGISVSHACLTKGISRQTLLNWVERGRTGEQPYQDACEQIDTAAAKACGAVTLTIMQAAKIDWRAGAWWLERRDPLQYGTKGADALASDERFLETLLPMLQPESRDDVLNCIAKLQGVQRMSDAEYPAPDDGEGAIDTVGESTEQSLLPSGEPDPSSP